MAPCLDQPRTKRGSNVQPLSIGDIYTMLKIGITILTMAPAVISIISSAVSAFEAASNDTDKVKVVVDALEKIAAEVKSAL